MAKDAFRPLAGKMQPRINGPASSITTCQLVTYVKSKHSLLSNYSKLPVPHTNLSYALYYVTAEAVRAEETGGFPVQHSDYLGESGGRFFPAYMYRITCRC
jgi:hypothetical protein